jgi:hyperosmotically inducible protein
VFGSEMKMSMKWTSLAASSLLALTLAAGCNNNKTNEHPDVEGSVKQALQNANLGQVTVSQDRDKGVLTLTGDVQSQDDKNKAEQVVQQNAPGYTLADEIGVRPAGAETQAKDVASDQDKAIEDNYKAMLKAHKALDDQSIDVKAKNGTLVLSGSVKTVAQKEEAGKLAKKVPNVQEVTNEIEVKPSKHSTARTSGGM